MSKLTTLKLEDYIKKALAYLENTNAADGLHYVSTILLYKRLNDLFVETATRIEIEEQSKYGWSDPDEHTFFVPENARWANILLSSVYNLGQTINRGFELIEDENPYLRGLFTSVDFNGKQELPDNTILQLLQLFNELDLSNQNLESPSVVGMAFFNIVQSLIRSSDTSLSPTPTTLSKLMVQLIKPVEGMRICDPTVGIGGCLIEVARFIEEQGERQENVTLYGHEMEFTSWALGKRTLLLHNIFDAVVDKRDTLRTPKLQDKKLLKYDRIVSVPPFSKKNWGMEEASYDPFDRFKWGIPPKVSGDYAFIQHIVSTLNEDGKASIVVPTGVLFRSGVEGEIRKSLVEEDLIESIIVLPSNLLINTSILTCIIVINRAKSTMMKDKILFIDGSNDFQTNRRKNELREEDVEKIVSTYESRKSITGYSRLVSLKFIQKESYSLVPSRYIENYDEKITEILKNLDAKTSTLGDISEEIRLYKKTESDQEVENKATNSIFYPLFNSSISPVLMSLDDEESRDERGFYAEIVLDPNRANPSYVCQFLNSQIGRRIRILLSENISHGITYMPMSVQHVSKLVIPVPILDEQMKMLQIQSKIRNTTTALHTMEQRLWGSSHKLKTIENKLGTLIQGDNLDKWYDSLPYPLASILLLYERSLTAREKEDHLLKFFEAFSQFVAVLLLSHFYKERILPEEVIKKIKGKVRNIKDSTFGTWITLGRKLASAATLETSFEDLFQYSRNDFLKMITDSSIFELLSEAKTFRNDDAHGGIVTEEISKERLVPLEAILSKLHEKIGNSFEQVTFLSPLQNSFRSGEFFFTIQNLVGPNHLFKKEEIVTNEPMDTEKLYLLYQGDKRPLELVPFITINMENKACYFYSKLVELNGKKVVHFKSYHYDKKPKKDEEWPHLQAFITEYLI